MAAQRRGLRGRFRCGGERTRLVSRGHGPGAGGAGRGLRSAPARPVLASRSRGARAGQASAASPLVRRRGPGTSPGRTGRSGRLQRWVPSGCPGCSPAPQPAGSGPWARPALGFHPAFDFCFSLLFLLPRAGGFLTRAPGSARLAPAGYDLFPRRFWCSCKDLKLPS